MHYLTPRSISILLILCLFLSSCSGSTPALKGRQSENRLTIVYPQSSTELVGGQSFRPTIILEDVDLEPIKGASVEATLWTPDGGEFATFTCLDKNDSRYLADAVTLPLKNSQGVWRITVQAELGDELLAQGEGKFIAHNSYSERLQELFGFWIELTDLFDYNVSNAEDPLLKTYAYEDGGYVILANNLTAAQLVNTFVILDVHWRRTEFPPDETAAANYVLNLAGPHRISLDISPTDLVVDRTTFRDWPAWQVTGWWEQSSALGDPEDPTPLDWVIFRCPGSDWLWTILITANEMEYLQDLKSIRDTFDCSVH